MSKRILQLIFSLLILKSMGYAQVNHNGDFQIWEYLSVEKELVNSLSSRLIGVMRWGDDASRFYFAYGQWQLVYRKKCIEVAPGYRQEYFRPGKIWLDRKNPMLDVTFFLPGKWRLEDRHRVIYHIREDLPSIFIYRNRLRLTTPEVDACLKLQFFIDDEIFYLEDLGFAQNRVSVGIFCGASSWVKGRAYYMYRNLKQGNIWTYQNVLAFHVYF